MIVIGVDAHTRTHTAAAVNSQTAVELHTLTVQATRPGHKQLLAWGKDLDSERVWALEDCRRLSGALELLLLAGRRTRSPGAAEDDGRHAQVAADVRQERRDRRGLGRPGGRQPSRSPSRQAPGAEREIRLVIDHRDDLIGECTRYQRRLRWYLHEIDPEIRPAPATLKINAHLDQLARKLAKLKQTRVVQISRELIKRIKDLVRVCQRAAPGTQPAGPSSLPRAALDRRLRRADGRSDPRRGRQRPALPQRTAPRDLLRRRTTGRQQRTTATPPPQPHRQPPAEHGAAHDRRHPNPDAPASPRLHRPPPRPGQNHPRSAPDTQTPPRPPHLQHARVWPHQPRHASRRRSADALHLTAPHT